MIMCQPQYTDSILLRSLAMHEISRLIRREEWLLEEEWFHTFKFLTIVSFRTTAKPPRAHK